MATKTIAIDGGIEHGDEPIPLAVLKTVYDEARRHGKTVPDDVVAAYADSQSEADDGHPDAGSVPDLAEGDLGDLITQGTACPFNWSDTADKTVGSGRDTGKEHMTTVYVRKILERCGGDMLQAVRLVTRHLIETGQWELAAGKYAGFIDALDVDATPDHVVAYSIATYAKGWLAEAILAGRDRFSKGSQSNDERGQDLYDRLIADYVQVKSVTFDKQKDDHIYYQWTCRGHLVYGDDLEEVNHAAADHTERVGNALYKGVEIGTTQLKKNRKGRRKRLLWW